MIDRRETEWQSIHVLSLDTSLFILLSLLLLSLSPSPSLLGKDNGAGQIIFQP
jgi:hypothetical protein